MPHNNLQIYNILFLCILFNGRYVIAAMSKIKLNLLIENRIVTFSELIKLKSTQMYSGLNK